MLGRKGKNILVIKTDGLSGFVAAEPAFAAIRQAHPDATISLLTDRSLHRIARASPYFDQVAAIPNFRDKEAKSDFLKTIRSAKFQRVYDLASDDAGRRLHAALGPFRPKWLSAAPAPRKKKTKKSTGDLPRFDRMLAQAGIDVEERLPDLRWALEARKDSANMQPSWFGISGPYGLLLPSVNPDRRWTARGYAGVASIMARNGIMPVLAGPKDLHSFGDEIAHETPQLVDLTGKTDHLQLAAMAQEAMFFVSDDAEELHLAVSVGCEGVLIEKSKLASAAPEGRHIVTLRAAQAMDEIDPVFVWRTLDNMGLLAAGDNAAGRPAAFAETH